MKGQPHTPAQIAAIHIVQRGLADELLWLGEITPAQRDALTYQPRHARVAS